MISSLLKPIAPRKSVNTNSFYFLGPHLQWLTIARELASPFFSFNREVHTLITLAAWQLGPLSDSVCEWHADLTVSSFGNALLHEMGCLLVKIKASWLEEVTIRTVGASHSSYLLRSKMTVK